MTKTKTIEDKYQKLETTEHVLLRPGMYIGSVKNTTTECWVMNEEKIKKMIVDYTPGFIKIFDEILSNATDHAIRDLTVNTIKVNISKDMGEISVWNNGSGLPVIIHKKHNVYIPELIFGHMLSGSNYDDNENRTVVGTNGVGGTVCNIFSKRFVIETVDSDEKKKYVQEFKDNMSVIGKPKITKSAVKSYTKITFLADFKKFDMKKLDDDSIRLLEKRVYDCIASTRSGLNIYLNDKKIKGNNFGDYTKYYFEDGKVISESKDDNKLNWEYAVIPNNEFEQVSFVNGNCTASGGKHVDYILYQIVSKLKDMLEKKKKLKNVKPHTIRERLFLFVKATVINPSFDSQTKDRLVTPAKDFGCKIEVSDAFMNKIYKSSIVDDIIEKCKLNESASLSKSDGKKTNRVYLPKLEDALWAGGMKSQQCTLMLTEGLSALTFSLWGRSVAGPEKYGAFPLKGKSLNIRDATTTQMIENVEFNSIKQILGLKKDKVYKDTSDLRYGKVIILTDSDLDGIHIRGLFINFIHALWPSLIKLDFIQTIRTPIVKAIKGKQILEFYTEQDYLKWQSSTTNHKNFQIRYFKGLGTSKKEDAKDTFRRLDELTINYVYEDKKCDEALLLAFDKDKNKNNSKSDIKCSDKRKEWLSKYDKDVYVKSDQNVLSYQDLVHKELIHFSIYDNLRSIPSICDGLKPSQRKIMFYMLKNNVHKLMKVAQLSGYVSAETGYHHGEASLQGAIVNMAQNFVGTNNINLLYPDGNFGSRFLAKDAASPRYIYTRLSSISNIIYNSDDSPLLNYLNDDGVSIEPEWFLPILPMVLVNGCEGIGTGYSTSIPSYNPKDILENMRRKINKKSLLPMKPYFNNFNGEVVDKGDGSFVTRGKWERMDKTKVRITELPVGSYITTYKEFLESLISKTTVAKRNIKLKDVENKTKDENNDICFIIEFKTSEELDELISKGTLVKELKLEKSFNTNNMYLFDEDLILTKYKTPEEIMEAFYKIRKRFYKKRKEYLTDKLKTELIYLKAKQRFIEEYIEGKLEINRQTKDYVIKLLEKKKYPKYETSYDYLTRLPISTLCYERIDELEKSVNKKDNELDFIVKTTIEELWLIDIKTFDKNLYKEE